MLLEVAVERKDCPPPPALTAGLVLSPAPSLDRCSLASTLGGNEVSKVTEPLRVSYSAVQDWRQCEQRYWYAHVEKLRPKVRQAAPELGTFIHEYFQTYYIAIQDHPADAEEWHRAALRMVLKKYTPQVKSLASLADNLGAEDEAKKLLAIPVTAKRLLNAYYRVRGQQDAQDHEILTVEHKFELPVENGIVLPGQIDLGTKTNEGAWLWEPKTTGSVPSQGRRFRDLQTLLYKVAVEQLLGYERTGRLAEPRVAAA